MKKLAIGGIIVLLILTIVLFLPIYKTQNNQNQPSGNQAIANLDDFAKCISSSGAKFYGAYWCSHCQNQKKLFGSSEQYIPYVECSAPNGLSQQEVCKDANIEGYPTWVFADGSRQSGELPLDVLAQKTGCSLPQ